MRIGSRNTLRRWATGHVSLAPKPAPDECLSREIRRRFAPADAGAAPATLHAVLGHDDRWRRGQIHFLPRAFHMHPIHPAQQAAAVRARRDRVGYSTTILGSARRRARLCRDARLRRNRRGSVRADTMALTNVKGIRPLGFPLQRVRKLLSQGRNLLQPRIFHLERLIDFVADHDPSSH